MKQDQKHDEIRSELYKLGQENEILNRSSMVPLNGQSVLPLSQIDQLCQNSKRIKFLEEELRNLKDS